MRPFIAMVCLLLFASAPLHAVEVNGDHENPNQEFGKSAHFTLTGDTRFGWRTGEISGSIDLNGHAFTMETGGGNHTAFSGAISGKGSFTWLGGGIPQVGPSVLTGKEANTFTGTFTLAKGVLDLDKPAGITAISGDLVIGTSADAVVRLLKANQIADTSNITFDGKGISGLDLQGYSEKFATLALKTHAWINMGDSPAQLIVGDSSGQAWDVSKTLTIRGFKPGKDRLSFGETHRGLTKEQLTRIGFDSPAGMPAGLYTARIDENGILAPDAQVRAVNPPFDLSPEARAARARLYEVKGQERLTAKELPLKDGLTIDFFGDSITWQNGYIEQINRAIQTRSLNVKLNNRGINGGGVLQVRDGSPDAAYPGKSAQKPFAEVIASDRADVAVIFIGINDIWWRKTTPEAFQAALRELIQLAKANKTVPVLATLTVHGELPDGKNVDDAKIDQFAELTRKVAVDTATTLVDLRAAYIAYLRNHNTQLRVDGSLHFTPQGILTYDGVHPNAAGVNLLAQLISDGIVRALITKTTVNAAPLKPGPRVDYSKLAFQPKAWEKRQLSLQLSPWNGKNIVFLTTDDSLDPDLIGKWVARLDAGWDLYADLTGQKPRPFKQLDHKATIAAVPGADLTCGAGCGYIGATGIELAMFYDHDYPLLKKHPDSMPHYVFYEMGRNYYTFADRHSCFITGFAVFMRYVCMDNLGCEDLDAKTRKVIEDVVPLFADSGHSFLELFTMSTGLDEKAARIRDKSGRMIVPSDQPVCYASAMLRLRRECGGDRWLKRFYRELATCPQSKPNTQEGALQQCWYWFLCASVAAQRDLSPIFAGEWRMPLSADTRAALARIDWKKDGLTVKEVAEAIKPTWKESDAKAEAALQLIPTPQAVTAEKGTLTLSNQSHIIPTDKALLPLARVLRSEIQTLTGRELAISEQPAADGASHILLRLDPSQTREAYKLEVADAVTLTAENYPALASATVTFLQLLQTDNTSLALPKVTIVDEPAHPYRGCLIDLARKYHTPAGVEQVIELCRLYKIRYLQLHLTDDQLFMFPSAAFPQAGKTNREFARFEPPSKLRIAPYTLDELRALETFAKERGVFLVPEIDMPGHSGRLIADARETFGIPGNGSTINIANPKTVEAATTLLNEVMDIFQSTPYIHLGADEVGLGGLEKTAEFRATQEKIGIKSVHDLYCKFITDMHDVVTKRGKKMIAWEEAANATGAYPLPKDTLVMVWSQGRNPNELVKQGYEIVNATWTPLYIVRDNKKSLPFLFDWQVPQFGREGTTQYTPLTDTKNLKGAQLCSWENSEAIEIQSLRDRLALVAQRTWNSSAIGNLALFKTKLAHTDALLEKLVHPITIQTDASFDTDENTFTTPFILTLKSRNPGLKIRYALDNSLPAEAWRDYTAPITIDRTVHLRAGLFNEAGQQQGYLVGAWYKKQVAR